MINGFAVCLQPSVCGTQNETSAHHALEIYAVLESARANAYRAVNSVMVQAYWHVGRLIVEHEQGAANAPHTALPY